jgi:hypothetical protein
MEAEASATDYLRFFALVSFGWLWVRMASKAAVAAGATTPLKQRKLVLARFFAWCLRASGCGWVGVVKDELDVDPPRGAGICEMRSFDQPIATLTVPHMAVGVITIEEYSLSERVCTSDLYTLKRDVI